jgi:hypothetical protein
MRSLRFSCLGFARLARLAGDPHPIAAGNAVRRIDTESTYLFGAVCPERGIGAVG